MELLTATIPTLAVASIYCLYNAGRRELERRRRRAQRLRERVAFLLWVTAHAVAEDEE